MIIWEVNNVLIDTVTPTIRALNQSLQELGVNEVELDFFGEADNLKQHSFASLFAESAAEFDLDRDKLQHLFKNYYEQFILQAKLNSDAFKILESMSTNANYLFFKNLGTSVPNEMAKLKKLSTTCFSGQQLLKRGKLIDELSGLIKNHRIKPDQVTMVVSDATSLQVGKSLNFKVILLDEDGLINTEYDPDFTAFSFADLGTELKSI